ncbi:MAG: 1-acyl-sn-glycerol-3-phosphate acyltransferase [Oscillospiraceae bacterium]|jgi:transcription elongation factor Elf1|nr:1-acyl-sn-glycerol-3-phosphate acyltransferase [Oscillospiraceae bacterium]
MLGDFKRFDMQRKPNRQRQYLRPVTWALSYPVVWGKRVKIEKTGMDGVKPPYLLLCNHNAFIDFMVMTAAIFPHRANYVVAIDGFLINEWLLRSVGCIGTRKFAKMPGLVKNMLIAAKQGDVVVLFPEARYSLCGTQSELPPSVGKLAKLMKIPVVSLVMHGHHIDSPFWNPRSRKAKGLRAELKLLLTEEQTQTMRPEKISDLITETLTYDEFAWQRENKIRVAGKKRASGLHKVLYQCPNCGAEYHMDSGGAEIWCGECGKRWEMDEYGVLAAKSGATEFSHIPDWYEWERANVRSEVRGGTYGFRSAVLVRSLPNAKGFIDLGAGELTHDASGFILRGSCQGERYKLSWSPRETFACHIEYNYKKRGDCIDLNTANDTLYIYPVGIDFSVTKLALATEELYALMQSGGGEAAAAR